MSDICKRALIQLTCGACVVAAGMACAGPLVHQSTAATTAQVAARSGQNHVLHSYPVVSGIGVALSITSAGPQIRKLIPDSVAARSGKLRAGDLLLAVRTAHGVVNLKGKPMGYVTNLIRGPVGDPVTLTVQSANGEHSIITLTRESVPLPVVSYQGLVGTTVTDVPFTTLKGSLPERLSQYKGRIVVLDLWAPWCGTCYAPLNDLQQVVRTHPYWNKRVVFLAASIHSTPAADRKAIRANRWTKVTFLRLSVANMEKMGVQVVPTLLVISPAGKIIAAGDPHAMPLTAIISKLVSRTGAT